MDEAIAKLHTIWDAGDLAGVERLDKQIRRLPWPGYRLEKKWDDAVYGLIESTGLPGKIYSLIHRTRL